jgi:hypothetical protein
VGRVDRSAEEYEHIEQPLTPFQVRYRSDLVNGDVSEPFPAWLCLANLQYMDGFGELAGAPGAAANAV